MLAILVVHSAGEVLRELVGQNVAGDHDERGPGQGGPHFIQGRLEEPPVGVVTVLAEGGELGALQNRLPLSGSRGHKVGK